MTYKELKDQLEDLNEDQLKMDVTIYDTEDDEFFGCYAPNLSFSEEDDTLDENHPYLTIKNG
ncbi:MAG: hypothetical protein IPH11_15510 [Ignavibacteriales bacterium]|nr:hypothetical protein [Ignavibacteriales bacterium]